MKGPAGDAARLALERWGRKRKTINRIINSLTCGLALLGGVCMMFSPAELYRLRSIPLFAAGTGLGLGASVAGVLAITALLARSGRPGDQAGKDDDSEDA